MVNAIFGYIRVSTKDQNEDRQLIAMRGLSIPEKNIYMDKQSGKNFERPQYKKMVRRMKYDWLEWKITMEDGICIPVNDLYGIESSVFRTLDYA